MNNTDFLVTLVTGVTLKVHPMKGSLTMDLILDSDYKGNVTGEKAIGRGNVSFVESNYCKSGIVWSYLQLNENQEIMKKEA